MTVLRAGDLRETHPYLPEGWRSSMVVIRSKGGPWPCDSCGGASLQVHRCSKCGYNLVDDGSTAGRQGVNR